MKILRKDEILNTIGKVPQEKLIEAIERAFTSYSNNEAIVPPVGHLGFQSPPGDVHIKYGYIAGEDNYVIKIASGFYDNPKIGKPTSNGMMLAFSAQTGELRSMLMDEGYLTDLRTALAGAVTAKYMAPKNITKIGIVGTGVQAKMQAGAMRLVSDCNELVVWGRSLLNAAKYKEEMERKGFNVSIATSIMDLAGACNMIICTTPSTEALLKAEHIQPGTHITAMGSDTPAKQELDPAILGIANIIACDSISQCVIQGEVAHALNAGVIDKKNLKEIGQIVSAKWERPQHIISVADLTGIATQDIAIASLVIEHEEMSLSN